MGRKASPSGYITSVRFQDPMIRKSFTQQNGLPHDVVSTLSLVAVKKRLSLWWWGVDLIKVPLKF